MTDSTVWLLPWAKLGREVTKRYPQDAHPVACHLLDVANVAHALWRKCLGAAVRQQWATALGVPEEDAGRWIAFWAGCHDIGKACPAFQSCDPGKKAVSTLSAAGLHCEGVSKVRHDHVSAHVLPELLMSGADWPAVERPLANAVAAVIGGHHGIIPTPGDYGRGTFNQTELGGPEWSNVRQQILCQLAGALQISRSATPHCPDSGSQGFLLLLAGLIAVSDWIGSSRRFFPPVGTAIDWDRYRRTSQQQSEAAVAELGWTGWRPQNTAAVDFRNLFRFEHPRPVQQVVEQSIEGLAGPALLLVEAPMGEGKTEAALFAADRFTHQHGGRGVYVALPTTASSNGMFARLVEFLETRYPSEEVNLQLLHGRTFLCEAFERLQLAAIDEDRAAGDSQVVAEEWFARNKRQGMLAPFAVGTVDQALLSVMQTRFAFVRLFGLAGRTVILDEVHAYDAYTSTILGRLLAWLRAIGSPVVLLSATLPRTTRHRLIAEYLHYDPSTSLDLFADDDVVPYPRVTLAEPETGRVAVQGISADGDRSREIRLRSVSAEGLSGQIATALAEGGMAAVICNTVSRAQSLFREMRDELAGTPIEVELFHARFPLGLRQEIEERVLERYGKSHVDTIRGPRVLIATQVIEQSLDLDFDLMVTEYAPIDLILQRAGRLHRHQRARPTGLADHPELWLLQPEAESDGVPEFGAFDGTVYDRYILLQTYLTLRNRSVLHLPQEIEPLVEAVYAEEPHVPDDETWQTALADSRRTLDESREASRKNAEGVLIPGPDEEDVFDAESRDLVENEDDPGIFAKSKIAKTREGRPTVEVVLAYDCCKGLSLTADGSQPFAPDATAPPDGALSRQIIECSVSLSDPACVAHFAACSVPVAWRTSAGLRFHRIARLDKEGNYRDQRHNCVLLRYTPTLGVEVQLREHESG